MHDSWLTESRIFDICIHRGVGKHVLGSYANAVFTYKN